MEALAAHPTVKPVSLVADALLDCAGRGDVVLDQLAGSGTTILAAEKVGRIGFGVEYGPGYVDVAIKRWQRSTKLEATLCGDGCSFGEIGAVRANSNDAPHRPGFKSTVAQPPQRTRASPKRQALLAARERRAARLRRIRRTAMPDRKTSKAPDYAVCCGRATKGVAICGAKAAIRRDAPKAVVRSERSCRTSFSKRSS